MTWRQSKTAGPSACKVGAQNICSLAALWLHWPKTRRPYADCPGECSCRQRSGGGVCVTERWWHRGKQCEHWSRSPGESLRTSSARSCLLKACTAQARKSRKSIRQHVQTSCLSSASKMSDGTVAPSLRAWPTNMPACCSVVACHLSLGRAAAMPF